MEWQAGGHRHGGYRWSECEDRLCFKKVRAETPAQAILKTRTLLAKALNQSQPPSITINRISEEFSANGLFKSPGVYDVYVSVFGKEQAARAVEILHCKDHGDFCVGRISVHTLGLGAPCNVCHGINHRPYSDECDASRFVLRLDSSTSFDHYFLQDLIKFSGARTGVSGSRYDWKYRSPQKFAHLWFRSKKDRNEATVDLASEFLMSGLLTRVPYASSKRGVPACCSACGMLDVDYYTGKPSPFRHTSDQRTQCPASSEYQEPAADCPRPAGWKRANQKKQGGGYWEDDDITAMLRNLKITVPPSKNKPTRPASTSPNGRSTGPRCP